MSVNRCIFCREARKISKEHVISEPIAKVFRLDRGSDRVASLDPRRMKMGPAISHDQRRVGLPCEPCNNGWMSQLEVKASSAFRDWCHRNPNLNSTLAGVGALLGRSPSGTY